MPPRPAPRAAMRGPFSFGQFVNRKPQRPPVRPVRLTRDRLPIAGAVRPAAMRGDWRVGVAFRRGPGDRGRRGPNKATGAGVVCCQFRTSLVLY